ncbi:MAG: hypothetical protein ABI383_01050 [Acidobacteriaceae bacterium]
MKSPFHHHPASTEARSSLARRVRLILLAALFASFLSTLMAWGATDDSGPVATAVVYVESNRPDDNSILAYHRNAQGHLVLMGEYATGGKGVFDLSLKLGPFDSDQEVVSNPERTLLFAVNSGSDTVAVFKILRSGALEQVSGSPFPSGGTNPVSVGFARDTLTVVNKAMDPARPDLATPSYVSFRVTPEGQLTAMLSSLPAAVGSSPTQADLSPSRRLLFDAQFLGGHLASFQLGSDGSLSASDLEGLPASESVGGVKPLPLGLWSHPKHPILYVGFVTVNKVGVYTYDATGQLKFRGTVHNSGQAVCWLRTNDQGTRLYTSNTADGSISVYDTAHPLTPVEIQHLKLDGLGNTFQIELDPDGRFLYVVTQRASPSIPLGEGNTLHVLRIDDRTGRVSEFQSVRLPVAAGVRPQGLAVVQPLAEASR